MVIFVEYNEIMNYYLFLLSVSFLFLCCEDANDVKDVDANTFYSDYMKIYEQMDSVGPNGTLEELNSYLSDYPEMIEAHVLKAYLLSELKQDEKANETFNYILAVDPTNLAVYEYRSAYALEDSSKWQEAEMLIEDGLLLNDSSAVLHNNQAWLNMLKYQDYDAAYQASQRAISLNTDNSNFVRTRLFASYMLENKEDAVSQLATSDQVLLNKWITKEISLLELYQSL